MKKRTMFEWKADTVWTKSGLCLNEKRTMFEWKADYVLNEKGVPLFIFLLSVAK